MADQKFPHSRSTAPTAEGDAKHNKTILLLPVDQLPVQAATPPYTATLVTKATTDMVLR